MVDNSGSISRSILVPWPGTFCAKNHILTKFCPRKLAVPVIMTQRVVSNVQKAPLTVHVNDSQFYEHCTTGLCTNTNIHNDCMPMLSQTIHTDRFWTLVSAKYVLSGHRSEGRPTTWLHHMISDIQLPRVRHPLVSKTSTIYTTVIKALHSWGRWCRIGIRNYIQLQQL